MTDKLTIVGKDGKDKYVIEDDVEVLPHVHEFRLNKDARCRICRKTKKEIQESK